MTSWSHGYNVSTGYTFGFYRETAPDWIDFALALRGQQPPRQQGGDGFRYCELGCGQGLGLCLLAAANPEGEFLGIDFSPEHVAHAAALAASLGLSNIHFVEGDFAELGAVWPAEFGKFEYVTLHGIYSWVPEAIRHSLVAILSAAVKPGGAVYVSFNALPGWVSTMPFQHILRLLEQEGVAKGIGAVEVGRELFEQMSAAGSGVTTALPALKSRIEGTRKRPAAYLVQEYLHENWHPMWCSKVMSELAGAKLGLAASATLAENLFPDILPKPLQEVLQGKTEPKLREDLTDCLINQTFRRDLYVRGGRRRYPGETAWRDSIFFWRANPAPMPEELTITTSFGTVMLKAEGIAPLMDAIGGSGCSLAELSALPAAATDRQLLNQKLILLLHGGWLSCSRRDPQATGSVAAINARIAKAAAAGAPYHHLAAARLGSAISTSDSDLLLLDAFIADPNRFENAGAAMLKERISALGRKLARDAQPLEGDQELAEAERLAAHFNKQTLPAWRRLGVID